MRCQERVGGVFRLTLISPDSTAFRLEDIVGSGTVGGAVLLVYVVWGFGESGARARGSSLGRVGCLTAGRMGI